MPGPYQPQPGDIKIRRENHDGTWAVIYVQPGGQLVLHDVHPHGFVTPPMNDEFQQLAAISRKFSGLLKKFEVEYVA